jgi:hypothetical protein
MKEALFSKGVLCGIFAAKILSQFYSITHGCRDVGSTAAYLTKYKILFSIDENIFVLGSVHIVPYLHDTFSEESSRSCEKYASLSRYLSLSNVYV